MKLHFWRWIFLCYFPLLFLYGPDASAQSAEGKDYATEMRIASQWLKQVQPGADSVSLEYRYRIGNILFFNDPYYGHFVLVADKRFHKLLDTPIFAFGLDGARYNRDPIDCNTVERMIDIYNQQLNVLASQDSHFGKSNRKQVLPLLGQNAWGQSAPYNALLPADRRGRVQVVGCGPVAMTQVMRFHRHPVQGLGSRIYLGSGKRLLEYDFTEVGIDWESVADSYGSRDKQSVTPLARLMYASGIAIDAQYGTKQTSAYLLKIKLAMRSHFGYSSAMHLYERLSDANMLTVIHHELDKGRPCIVADNSHIFLCDGRMGAYLHLNMGWNGMFNGYYRASILDGCPFDQISFDDVLAYILPDDGLQLHKEIQTRKGGELSNLLSEKEKRTVTELVISGPINADDIKLIRQMAGAPVYGQPLAWQGRLEKLDLGNATIRSSKEPFMETSADGWSIMTSIGTRNSHSFDLDSKLSDADWKDITRESLNHYDDHVIVRENGHFVARFFAHPNHISDRMFYECRSLRQIVLPQKIADIGRSAFAGCIALESLTLPESVRTVGDMSFCDTYSLKQVTAQMPVNAQGTTESLFRNTAPFCRGIVLKR